ncbi:ornithine cyclodeaminase family protein [Thermoflexus hugenholtzii]|uniref:Ornithine cyclodeaminase n=1 Tax=Thermoflexus hugenholtzii JAD2 TaxID=877466 RepID=A0A212QW75_9CHLR|nr:ornithine cyclodeaminase [Thermoflexus hugenholtzii]SNB63977.1 ornithine cyclodeaminase [Thermoflexus hugenholtzii JAD2]
MTLPFFTAEDIRRALPMREAIEAMRAAFIAFSEGRAHIPQRLSISIPEQEGITLVMPGYVPPDALGLKVVSVFPRNPARGLPTLSALVVMLDPETGAPAALLDGAFLTAWRTGAASGLATDLLARPDAESLALIGAGAQARTQLLAVAAVRSLRRVRVYSRTPARAQALIEELRGQEGIPEDIAVAPTPEAAVAEADIVCTATNSSVPVFDGRALQPGTHINAIGSFTLEMRELDEETFRRAARVVVDSRAAALAEAGEVVWAIRQGILREADLVELGEIAAGRRPGRERPEEITLFKSVGLAVQDLVAAQRVWQRIRAQGG